MQFFIKSIGKPQKKYFIVEFPDFFFRASKKWSDHYSLAKELFCGFPTLCLKPYLSVICGWEGIIISLKLKSFTFVNRRVYRIQSRRCMVARSIKINRKKSLLF